MRQQLLVNGVLLALALGTFGVLWATREAPTTNDLTARKNKLLPSFDKESVTRIRLTQAGRELELVRGQPGPSVTEFRITRPWSERADIATVNQLLSALDLASTLRPADDVSLERAALNEQALRIVLEMPNMTEQLTLGGPAPSPAGARYAELARAGGSRRYLVSQGVVNELSMPFDKFREARLLEFGRSELARIQLSGPGDALELEQREHGSFFILNEGSAELAKREAVERLLTGLSRLSSEQFVEPEPARAALGNQPFRVRLQLQDKTAAPVVLSFASSCPAAPELALVLTEQSGKTARAGCIAGDIVTALHVTGSELHLAGPFSARPDEVEELHIRQGDRKLDLARKDKAFLLRAPTSGEVPLDAGNQRIAAILSARGERAAKAPASAFGLEQEAGEISIQVAGSDEVAHREERVLLGKPRSDGSICLRRRLDGVTLCFDAETARAFEPDATLLKGLGLLGFAASELVSFSVETEGLREVVRRTEEGSYVLDEPRGYSHDGSLVADAVQTLGALRAARWVAPSDQPAFGLAKPRLQVKFNLTPASGTSPRELRVGAPTGGGFFAQLTPDPGVFVLPRSAYSDLSTPLIDRALCRFGRTELIQIEVQVGTRKLSVTRQGETWSGSSLSPARTLELVEAVTTLRADFAAHVGKATAAEGFARPSATISLVGPNGKHERLLLGARGTLDDSLIVYARLDSVNATFALARRSAEVLEDF